MPAAHGSSEAVLVVQTVFAELAVDLGLGSLLVVLTVIDTRVAPSDLAAVLGLTAIFVAAAAPRSWAPFSRRRRP